MTDNTAPHTDEAGMDAPGGPGAPAQGTSALKIISIGCVILFAVVLAVGLYVASNWRTMLTGIVRVGMDSSIAELRLSPAQLSKVTTVVDKVLVAFEDGRVSSEQVGQILEAFGKSPGAIVIPIALLRGSYVEPSGLSDDEKVAGRLSIERYARGIVEGSIPSDNASEIGLPFEKNNNAKKLTDEELRQLLARMKAQADEAEIPEELYDVDIAASFEDAVTRVLGEGWDEPK